MATDTTIGAAQVLDGWRAQGIRFVRFELPDMHGTSRSKMVPIERAYGYAESGLNMYGGVAVLDSRSDVVGGTLYHEEVAYGDQMLLPDLETAAVVPWREATARWICDSTWADGTPLEALPRRVWRKQLERARALGYEPLIGYEPEFYLLTGDQELLFEGYHIFNVTRNTYVPFIQELVDQLNAYGLEVITANCEYAGSQWELPCLPQRGMGGPDRCFSFKNAVKELAHLHGYTATFMSKPFADSAGSGLHTHVSLLNVADGGNAFGDASDEAGDLGRVPQLHRRQPAPRRVHLCAARSDGELHEAPPHAHVQPYQRVLGAGGPLGADPDQGRHAPSRGTSSTVLPPACRTRTWWGRRSWRPG